MGLSGASDVQHMPYGVCGVANVGGGSERPFGSLGNYQWPCQCLYGVAVATGVGFALPLSYVLVSWDLRALPELNQTKALVRYVYTTNTQLLVTNSEAKSGSIAV